MDFEKWVDDNFDYPLKRDRVRKAAEFLCCSTRTIYRLFKKSGFRGYEQIVLLARTKK